jgi:two-component sensor histidine kinase
MTAIRHLPAWLYLTAIGLAAGLPVVVLGSSLLFAYAEQESQRLQASPFTMVREIRARLTLKLAGYATAVDTIASAGMLTGGDLERLDGPVRGLARREGLQIRVSDETGRIRVHSAAPPGAELPMTGNLQTHREADAAGDRPAISGLITGTMSRQFLVAITARLRGEGRSYVSFGVPVATLASIFEGYELPPSGVIGVFDRDGIFIARSRYADRFVGKPGTPELLERIRAEDTGQWVGRGLEGHLISVAFAHEPLSGWTVVARVLEADLKAPLNRVLWQTLGLALVTFAVSIALAWLASRPILTSVASLSQAAKGVGGEAPLPPPPQRHLIGEFGEIDASLRAADASIRDQVERNKLLTRELRHRVKNVLATVQAVSNATLRNSSDMDSFRRAFDGRVAALARSHVAVNGDQPTEVDLGRLVAEELTMFSDHVELDGPVVRLRPEQAVSLGLAIHELATNAAKYGALSSTTGHVSLTWQIEPGEGAADTLRLMWRESGGPAVVPPGRTGFGSQLLKAVLVRQHHASVDIDFNPAGVAVTIALPVGEGQGGRQVPAGAPRDSENRSCPSSMPPPAPAKLGHPPPLPGGGRGD